MSNFWQRLITGTLFVAVIVGSILFSAVAFQIIFLWVALLSLEEFYRLVKSDDRQPDSRIGWIAGATVYILTAGIATWYLQPKWSALIMPVMALVFFAELYRRKNFPFNNIAFTLLGIVYTVLPFAMLSQIATSIGTGAWNSGVLLGYFILIWSSDTFAYIFGNLFGKHRLFERISPKKSWEGSLGGAISSLGIAWILWKFNPDLALIHWMVISVIIVITGTLGDLTESMLKRSLNIKDSGTILPGHGGFLDRFDALLLSAPFVWAYLKLIA
ncbi:phosphatidate cytidylyltransferase [soil metagenome]